MLNGVFDLFVIAFLFFIASQIERLMQRLEDKKAEDKPFEQLYDENVTTTKR